MASNTAIVRLLAFADRVLHALRVPHRLWWRLCDAYDLSLGVPDTPENFPRRHGYSRMSHVYSGSSSYPERSRCMYCQQLITEPGPCLLTKVNW